MDCLFCRIASGQVPTKKVYEDEEVVAFEDINPQAPVHMLVIPRKHTPTLNDLGPEDDATLGRLHRVAAELARDRDLSERGYRVVMNCNEEAGQTVFHIHLHLLGGRRMKWPPG